MKGGSKARPEFLFSLEKHTSDKLNPEVSV